MQCLCAQELSTLRRSGEGWRAPSVLWSRSIQSAIPHGTTSTRILILPKLNLPLPPCPISVVVSFTAAFRDIYALCEAFPTSYADRLYKETQALLQNFVAGLLEVKVHTLHNSKLSSMNCLCVLEFEESGVCISGEWLPALLGALPAGC